MRRLARLGLWILGLIFPVFLAACYGPPNRYSRHGDAAGGTREPAAAPRDAHSPASTPPREGEGPRGEAAPR